MASDPVFSMFPEPSNLTDNECHENTDMDRFVQKQYPMLYAKLNAQHQPQIAAVELCPPNDCRLCKLDNRTTDAIKVLKPFEVRSFLVSRGHEFTEEEVNIHLGHTVSSEENVIGVLQNMSIDLIGRSYVLANRASLHIMNRVTTHIGQTYMVPDQDVAKIHNDAIKQFIGLTSTCQTLLKHRLAESNDRALHPLL